MYYYASASVEKILINIWYHQMHRRVKRDQKCSCDYFIICCELSAWQKWKKEYIDFNVAIKKFKSLNLKLTNIMALNNEKKKDLFCKEVFKRSKKKILIFFYL